MRSYFLLFIISTLSFSISAVDLGGALSIDYYNNPVRNYAPSPVQNRPTFFHNYSIGFFNIRSGFGILEANYTLDDNRLPVFNEVYNGFYTVEFDIYTSPGFIITLNKLSLGLAPKVGVRLPVISGIDSQSDKSEMEDAFNWFYEDYRFFYWGAEVFFIYKLLNSSTFDFFTSIGYRKFQFRDDQWTIGATVGLLWHI